MTAARHFVPKKCPYAALVELITSTVLNRKVLNCMPTRIWAVASH